MKKIYVQNLAVGNRMIMKNISERGMRNFLDNEIYKVVSAHKNSSIF